MSWSQKFSGEQRPVTFFCFPIYKIKIAFRPLGDGGRLCYVCQGSRLHVYGGIFLIWPPPVSKRVLFYFLFPPKITQGCAFCESARTSVSAAPLPYNKTDRKAFFRAAAGEEISYLGGCEREKKDGVSLSVSIMGHVAVRRCCSCHCYQK
jgi:hypothetical protein